MTDPRAFGTGFYGQAQSGAMLPLVANPSNLLDAYLRPGAKPAMPSNVPPLPHPLDLTQPPGSPLAGFAPPLMLLPTGPLVVQATAQAAPMGNGLPMPPMPLGSAAPVNPPAAADGPGVSQTDTGAPISPAYIQALQDRLQQNPPAMSTANSEGLRTTIPLVNGKIVAGGEYHVYNIDHLAGYDTDPSFEPKTAAALTAAIAEMNAQGIRPEIDTGFRTAAEQAYDRKGGHAAQGPHGIRRAGPWISIPMMRISKKFELLCKSTDLSGAGISGKRIVRIFNMRHPATDQARRRWMRLEGIK